MNFNSVINPIVFLLSALLMSIIILEYDGTPKDKVLIWEKGMELPKTSEEVEKSLGF